MPSKKQKSQEVPAPPSFKVTLRTDTGEEVSFESGAKLQKAAVEWRAIVRNRRRWADAKSSREEKDHMAQAQLLMLGVGKSALDKLAEARVIEVSIPFANETTGWEARVFPWEHVVGSAVRMVRPGTTVTVVRHLACAEGAPTRTPEKLLFVESAPGKLCDAFTLETERRLVTAGLALGQQELSQNETAQQLKARLAAFAPDVIHLAGFDSHQALGMGVIHKKSEGEPFRDGYLMAGDKTDAEIVEAEALAALLNSADAKPRLIGCNLYNSASRICALAVAGGAGAAIGFQDEFDDNLAELFFCNFYQAWNASGWNTLAAFQAACQTLREQNVSLRGTGLVLWSRESLLRPRPRAVPRRRAKGGLATAAAEIQQTQQTTTPADETVRQLRQAKERTLPPGAGLLQVDVKPNAELNYSMLHNNRGMFEEFKISRAEDGRVEGLEIGVTLYVGDQTAQYTARHDMPEKLIDLNPFIRVPLLHSAWAGIIERVHTSLAISIKWGDYEIYRRTHRIALLPLDQWRDDEADRVWLPSFVLPRDPAIRGIVDNAQRYLMALRDDSGAGFDGYQSFDANRKSSPELAAEDVDDQVRALWAALIYDHSISYINPPPTYSAFSQRLRSPSEVLAGRRGTCIDTTLLLAALLEYVEIYPVIFLLTGHAFVGYWRHYDYQQEFTSASMGITRGPATELREEEAVKEVEQYGWFYKKDSYELLLQFVSAGKLVPIESTMMTGRGGFWDSIEEGVQNLRNRRDFDSLVDVSQARGKVTPIPMK